MPAPEQGPFITPPPEWPATVRLFQPPQLTDEQRAQMREAMANVTEGLRHLAEAVGPAALRAGEEIARLGEQLRASSSYRPEWANHFAFNPRHPR
ncbi:hypothetical protein ACWHLZ_27955 [Streptomyces chartreusis]|uniref:hypothetical protein n=1 Tax=Streptomyces chartreusis TaxID=1969 RepID=UPI0034346BB1